MEQVHSLTYTEKITAKNVFEDLEKLYPSQTHKLHVFKPAYELLKDKPGDFAEFGVYNGNGSRELASLDSKRTVWAFDTFEGMPIEDYNEAEDYGNPPGKWKPGATPKDLFAGINNIKPVVGRFTDTLPTITKETKFVLVHLDCDYYASYKQVLDWLSDGHLVDGSVLFVDDWDCEGCKRAVKEWLEVVKSKASFDGFATIVWHG